MKQRGIAMQISLTQVDPSDSLAVVNVIVIEAVAEGDVDAIMERIEAVMGDDFFDTVRELEITTTRDISALAAAAPE